MYNHDSKLMSAVRTAKSAVALALVMAICLSLFAMAIPSFAVEAGTTTHDHYFYDQLQDDQKAIYDAMKTMLDNGQLAAGESCAVNSSALDDQVAAYTRGDGSLVCTYAAARDAFAADHPEAFWVNFDKLSFIVTQDSAGALSLRLGSGRDATYYNAPFTSQADVEAAQVELAQVIANILADTDGLTDKEIIAKVHNAIILGCSYRLELTCDKGNEDLVRTAYGALVKGQALCEGYSEAMKLVLDAAGIPCVYVTGYVKIDGKPQLHAWNEVMVDGAWYAVDATFDDPIMANPNDDKGNDGGENTVYLLVGANAINRTHQADGIMSDANYEFIYPTLSENEVKFDSLVNNGGLEVQYSGSELSGGYETATFQVSYNGMGYAEAAKRGYWILSKSYLYSASADATDLTEMDWAYLEPEIYGLEDTETYVSYSAPQIAYVEFAVTTTPIGDTSDFRNLYFKGDPTTMIAESGLLHNAAAHYVAPPYPCEFSPANTIILDMYKEYDVVIKYDDQLAVKEGETPGVTVTRTDTDGSIMTGSTNYETGAVTFDSEANTLSFHFKPSTMYADDSIIYTFTFTGVQGKESGKDPKPVNYGARSYSAIRSSNCARLYGWNVFGKPALLDIPADISGWTLDSADGQSIPAALTDRMALVVEDASPKEAHDMETLVADQGDAILASESYNIDLTLCRGQVVTNGAAVSVKIGFPGDYDAHSDVTYKVYHFIYGEDGTVTGVEEIPCVVTEYGLIAYCSSFSPYMVAAVERTDEETQSTDKTIAMNSTYGGAITASAGTGPVVLSEGQSVTFTAKADEGYQLSAINACGKTVTVDAGAAEASVTVAYDDVGADNIVEALFIAQAVIEALPETTTVVGTATEPVPVTSHTVTYHYDGKTMTACVENGGYAENMAVSKDGHTLDGWYSDAELTKLYNFDTPVTSNVTLYGKFTALSTPVSPEPVPDVTHTVTYHYDGQTVTATVKDGGYAENKTVFKTGYTFDGWFSDASLTTPFDFTTAITRDVTLYSRFTVIQTPATPSPSTGSSSDSSGSYRPASTSGQQDASTFQIALNYDETRGAVYIVEDGKTTRVTTYDAKAGSSVTFSIVPNEGYILGDVLVDGNKTSALPNDALTLDNVTAAHAISIAFTKTVAAIYSDVSQDAWYTGAVQYAVDNGLMEGISATEWSPGANFTRAEAAAILVRMDKGDPAGHTAIFADVGNDTWYAPYIAYCAEQGYMVGRSDDVFAPQAPLSREEFAVILYRRAGSPAVSDVDLLFVDATKVSVWATDAMCWAVEQGIYIGDGTGYLSPKDDMTRAQVATVLQRILG